MEGARDLVGIGRLIKYHRQRQNLSQQELAKMAGTTQMTVYKIENGNGGTIKVLIELLRAMNLEMSANPIQKMSSKNISDFLES